MREAAIQFVVYGLLFAAVCWLVREIIVAATRGTKGILTPIVGLIGVLLLMGIYIYFTYFPKTLGERRWFQETPVAEIILFVFMLLGMCASYVTKQIDKRRVRIEERRKAGDQAYVPLEFDLWEFTYPMLVSVITFGAVLQTFGEKLLDIPALILSFQTGFFWQTVLARAAPK